MSQDISTERLQELIEWCQPRPNAVQGVKQPPNSCQNLTDALLELKRRREEDRWIPVAERLPELQTEVIGVVDLGKGCLRTDLVARSGNTGEFNHGYRIIPKPPVTYWRPIPAAPKES